MGRVRAERRRVRMSGLEGLGSAGFCVAKGGAGGATAVLGGVMRSK